MISHTSHGIDFDVEIMERWVREIRPETCYVGYDSKQSYLPEPELAKVEALMKKLKETIDRSPSPSFKWPN